MAKKQETHVIHFEVNGGKPIDDLIVGHQKKADLPWPSGKDGLEWVDWFEDSELTKPFDEKKRITEDVTLYAGYGHSIYLKSIILENGIKHDTLGFESGGYVRVSQGERITDEDTDNIYAKFLAGREVTVTASPKDGFSFVGWVPKIEDDFYEWTGEVFNTEINYSFILNKDIDLGALFVKTSESDS